MAVTVSPAYNAWANRVLIDALQRMERPQGVDRILAHLAVATEVWLGRLDGLNAPTPDLWPTLPFEESMARIEAADLRLEEPRDLEARVVYRNSAGQEFDDSVVDIMAHVLNHGTYHRGQIASLLVASGQEPPLTDFIVYVRSLKP